MRIIDQELLNKFLYNISIPSLYSCWEWKASKTNGGYGSFTFKKKTQLAHRTSWLLAHGEVPANMCVLHTCDNPPCVNPSHLFLGTHTDNMRDKTKKGHHHQLNKTHCPQGHSYSDVNLYIDTKGYRRCIECRKINLHKYREKNREKIRKYDREYYKKRRKLNE